MTATRPRATSVAVESDGPLLWIYLDRPDALNALTPTMIDELAEALDVAVTDNAARCVILAGRGRAFCAGADLTSLRGSDTPDEHRAFSGRVGQVFSQLERLPKPTVAAVHGVAVAGGLELALCCDLIIAAEGAQFGDGHANFGMLPGGGASVRLPRRIGTSRAKALMFTGAIRPAKAFVDTDLVAEIVPDAQLTHRVSEFARAIASKSPLGLALMKTLVGHSTDLTTEQALAVELSQLASYEHSSDFAEGLAAFAAKRAPRFTGR